MTNEAVLRDTKIISSKRFTCATSTAITKGALLMLSDDNTAALGTDGGIFVGVCHADVNSSTDSSFNTETSVTADKGAIYDLVASGAIAKGKYVALAGDSNFPNTVRLATDIEVASNARCVVGMALEAASDAERINVEVFA